MRYATIERFPGYRFGEDGTVERCWRAKGARRNRTWHQTDEWKPVKTCTISSGYLQFSVIGKGNQLVHRAILEAFIGPCPVGCEGCHDNDIKTDNHIDNLRWDTRKANLADSLRNGRRPIGEAHWAAKLEPAHVRRIRQLREAGITIAAIAKQYGVSRDTIGRVSRGVSYADV